MSLSSLSSTASAPLAAGPEAVPGGRPAREVTVPDLWLVRHGESTWNTAGLAQGHNDEAELTERGLRQAADAAAQFGYRPVRAIYASDLRRAQQTAAAFSAVLGLPVQHRPAAAGAVPRRARGQPAQHYRPFGHWSGGRARHRPRRPAASRGVGPRPVRAGRRVLRRPRRRPGRTQAAATSGDVLVIAHGGTVRVLDAYIHGVPVDQMTWRPVDNATIVRIPEFGTQSRGGSR